MGPEYCDATSNEFNGTFGLRRRWRAVPRSRSLFQGTPRLNRFFTAIVLKATAVQPDRPLGLRLLFLRACIEPFSYGCVPDCPNAAGPSEPKRTKSSASGGQTGACYRCGQEGHWANGALWSLYLLKSCCSLLDSMSRSRRRDEQTEIADHDPGNIDIEARC